MLRRLLLLPVYLAALFGGLAIVAGVATVAAVRYVLCGDLPPSFPRGRSVPD